MQMLGPRGLFCFFCPRSAIFFCKLQVSISFSGFLNYPLVSLAVTIRLRMVLNIVRDLKAFSRQSIEKPEKACTLLH